VRTKGRELRLIVVGLVLILLSLAGCQAQSGGIEGTVTDANGSPVPAMRIFIVSGTAGFPEIAVESNKEGYYQLGGTPPGTFEVVVHDMDGERIAVESVAVRSRETVALNFIVPVATATSDGELTEEQFSRLLSISDIRQVLMTPTDLIPMLLDQNEVARSANPEQAAVMDSFFVLHFRADEEMKDLIFSMIDFDSPTSAQNHLDRMKSEGPGLEDMEPPIGDASVEVKANSHGTDGAVIFIKGDKFVQLHTMGEQPIIDLEGLEELARIVESRL
jgi:hypothetical protein